MRERRKTTKKQQEKGFLKLRKPNNKNKQN